MYNVVYTFIPMIFHNSEVGGTFSLFLSEETLKLFFHISFLPHCYVWIETFVILPYRPLDMYLMDDVFVTHQKRVHLPPVRPHSHGSHLCGGGARQHGGL